MKRLIVIAFLILIAIPAMCDGTDTLISWPGWVVSSTENLYMGHKHTSFPLTNLFDGDQATVWVFSGKGKNVDGRESGYAITLARDEDSRPIKLDSIWLMNGYNKNAGLFFRNNRITQLKLYVNGKFVKTVTLADAMGWHKISIPRQSVREIRLSFTKFAVGRDDDICISELALYDKGNKINFKMPKAVEYTEGDGDCGDGQEFYVIDRTGRRLADYDMEAPCVWSPSHRYVAAASSGDFWVIDASIGKTIMHRTLSMSNWEWTEIERWRGDQAVVVSFEKSTPKKSGADDYDTTYYSKVIKITR